MASVNVETEGEKVSRARVVLYGVAPIPWRSEAAEEAITAKAIDLDTAAEAGAAAVRDAKPLSMNGPEGQKMVEAVEKAKVPNMVWYNYRRVPAVTFAHRLIEEGRLGRIFHYRAKFLQDWTISPDVPQGGTGTWRLDAAAAGSGVTGDLYIDQQRPAASSVGVITVDIRGMTSDLSGHDDARNDYLDTRRYPNVVYTPKRLVGLREMPYAEGQEVTFQLVGDMAVGTGRSEVTFDVTGKIVGTTFTGTATAKVQLTDFGYQVPRMTALELDNNVYLEVVIVAERAP